jgi:hypothetical protein
MVTEIRGPRRKQLEGGIKQTNKEVRLDAVKTGSSGASKTLKCLPPG